MKFKSLYIKNFRILEDFQVKKLGRLNLIVGKNNSGKSTVLEALRIYSGNANPVLLSRIADEHDEIPASNDKDIMDNDRAFPFESFFTGRCFPSDEEKTILIGENENASDALQLRHTYLIKREEPLEDGRSMRSITRPIKKSELSENIDAFHAISVSKGDIIGFIPLDEPFRPRRFNSPFENQINLPCSYISTRFISQDELADAWDKIALTGYETHLKTVLKFIDDDFENIAFIKNEDRDADLSFARSFYSRSPKRFAKVKLNNIKQPIPLNSMGDGMLRVVQLALKASSAAGGIFLIDEFDNGLHFSVQEKIWDWLFDLAKEFNIQVFATTHGGDCVDSFVKVALGKKAGEGVLFRVGRSATKSNKGKIIATEFSEEKLATISQADVEVR